MDNKSLKFDRYSHYFLGLGVGVLIAAGVAISHADSLAWIYLTFGVVCLVFAGILGSKAVRLRIENN